MVGVKQTKIRYDESNVDEKYDQYSRTDKKKGMATVKQTKNIDWCGKNERKV